VQPVQPESADCRYTAVLPNLRAAKLIKYLLPTRIEELVGRIFQFGECSESTRLRVRSLWLK